MPEEKSQQNLSNLDTNEAEKVSSLVRYPHFRGAGKGVLFREVMYSHLDFSVFSMKKKKMDNVYILVF